MWHRRRTSAIRGQTAGGDAHGLGDPTGLSAPETPRRPRGLQWISLRAGGVSTGPLRIDVLWREALLLLARSPADVGNAPTAAGFLALAGAAIHLPAVAIVDQAAVLALVGAEGGSLG